MGTLITFNFRNIWIGAYFYEK